MARLIFLISILILAGTFGLSSSSSPSPYSLSSYYQYNRALSAYARSFPTINNGDTIALRWAHTSYITWLTCSHGSACRRDTCPGRHMTYSKWHSCPKVGFHIIAWNKKKGEPINSGDTIVLSPVFGRHIRWRQGYAYYMYCHGQCRRMAVQNLMTANNLFFQKPKVHFQLFSRQANDGSPVQHGDIVGLKVPSHCNSCWMYRHANTYFYSAGCSTNKLSCAKEGRPQGFQIYKMM